ncbi:bifunctional hydroxymethylpyrimidine kinase/phosphomethylpyrimidine kinase (plasmid) [Cytobacillus spongiae]|uniref:bifunctional hydroxymethylpyrimidine kinase/phosphomethylpyrimidine kinase n=1 Tax=Cytobacillus spongiae TaxID=2901381 RepID=UPI001F2EB209|nr:bifunctional hydroxymethylpyrimidine kinase/phosphomethylpyrimidine kinase [Cytobacillus spongiae]UII58428.1 bifunctional hydroxymethylpyrimidine kinase/phosphomethylpyrimidine kinase [Cytobacillus spongiae]
MIQKALTIAGSDSGGGAGIQADLKTFQEMKVYGMSAVTAVTAQNTKGVQSVYPLSPETVIEQLNSIAEDLTPQAVKTGMLVNGDIISETAAFLHSHSWDILVVDPVMVAKGGAPLLEEEAVYALKHLLLPLAYVITPNIPEAEALTGMDIQNDGDCMKAAEALFHMGAKHVVIKGGHQSGAESYLATDILFDGKRFYTYTSPRVSTPHTHGTGCTFSAVITAQLAKGLTVHESVQTAKHFITAAISDTLGIGTHHGPTNHWAYQAGMKI